MKHNKKGDAMIMVICIMAIFLALSLAAILSASTLMSGSIKSRTKEQCRLSAITFSKVLEAELTRKNDYEDRKNGSTDSLRSYLRKQMESGWTYYNEDELGHSDLKERKKEFDLDSSSFTDLDHPEDNFGEIHVAVYWTAEAGEFGVYKDYSSAKIAVEVTCGKKGQKQKIRTWYNVVYEAYDGSGVKQTTDEWEPSQFSAWELEEGKGNILAWKWQVSEVR